MGKPSNGKQNAFGQRVFNDKGTANFDEMREKIYDYANNHQIKILSKFFEKNNTCTAAGVKNGEPVFIGCRQVSKKNKVFLREQLSQKDQQKWLLLTK